MSDPCRHERVAVVGSRETTELSAYCADCRASLPVRYEGDGGSIHVVRTRDEVPSAPYRGGSENRVEVCGDGKPERPKP